MLNFLVTLLFFHFFVLSFNRFLFLAFFLIFFLTFKNKNRTEREIERRRNMVNELKNHYDSNYKLFNEMLIKRPSFKKPINQISDTDLVNNLLKNIFFYYFGFFLM